MTQPYSHDRFDSFDSNYNVYFHKSYISIVQIQLIIRGVSELRIRGYPHEF